MRSTFSTYRRFSALAAICVVSAASASAQKTAISTTTTQTLRSSFLTPLATANFAPLSFGGTFNGSLVSIGLSWVTVNYPNDPALMGLMTGSNIGIGSPQGIANGNYSVVLSVPWSNAAQSLEFLGTGGAPVATCNLQQQLSYAAGAPVQQCDTGQFAITNGKLEMVVRIKNPNPGCPNCTWPNQLSVSQITLNLWR